MTSILDNVPLIGWANTKLQGEPDYYLTIFLVGLAVFGFLVALFGPPLFKAALIAWWVMP